MAEAVRKAKRLCRFLKAAILYMAISLNDFAICFKKTYFCETI